MIISETMKNKKMNKKICSVLRFLISLCIFIGFSLVFFDLRVNAAQDIQVIQVTLPYYVDPDLCPFTNNDFKIAYDNEPSDWYNSISSQFENKKFLVYFQEHANGGDIYIYYQINTNNGISLNGTPYADFNPQNDYLTWSFTAYKITYFYRDGVLYKTGLDAVDRSYNINLLGFSNNIGANPLLIKETENWADAPVLVLGAPQVVVNGAHTVPPDFQGHSHSQGHFNSPDYTGSGLQEHQTVPPTYTYNYYNWTTPTVPPFDDTDILTGLESLGDIINYLFGWLSDNLKNEFENLTDNIAGLVEFLADTMRYYGDLIINNIQAFAQNIYDNLESLFMPFYETIKDFVEFFIKPFDSTQAQYDISNSSFITQISTTKTQLQTFVGSFNNIAEPSNIVYTMDFTNLFYNFGVWVIDFSVISPVLPYIRTVIAAILLYSLIVNIFTSINAYIGGNSSKNESD